MFLQGVQDHGVWASLLRKKSTHARHESVGTKRGRCVPAMSRWNASTTVLGPILAENSHCSPCGGTGRQITCSIPGISDRFHCCPQSTQSIAAEEVPSSFDTYLEWTAMSSRHRVWYPCPQFKRHIPSWAVNASRQMLHVCACSWQRTQRSACDTHSVWYSWPQSSLVAVRVSRSSSQSRQRNARFLSWVEVSLLIRSTCWTCCNRAWACWRGGKQWGKRRFNGAAMITVFCLLTFRGGGRRQVIRCRWQRECIGCTCGTCNRYDYVVGRWTHSLWNPLRSSVSADAM